jgi:hypothetical protein
MYTTINSSSTKVLGTLSCFNNLVLISFSQTYLDSFTISIYKDNYSFDDVDDLDMDASLSVSFSFRSMDVFDLSELMKVPFLSEIDDNNWMLCLARRLSEVVSRVRCDYDSPVFVNFKINEGDLVDDDPNGMLNLLHIVQEVSQKDDLKDSIEISAGILSALAYRISYSSTDELVSDSYNENVSTSYLFNGKTDLVPSLLDVIYSLLVPSSRASEISVLADSDTQLRSLMFGVRDMIDPDSHVSQIRKVLTEENDRFNDVASLVISDDLAYVVQKEMEDNLFDSGWGYLFNGRRYKNLLDFISETIRDFQGIRERTDMIYYIPLVLAMNYVIYSSPAKSRIDSVIKKYDSRIASAAQIISKKSIASSAQIISKRSTKYIADEALIEIFLRKTASLVLMVSESESSVQRFLSRAVRISFRPYFALPYGDSVELDFTNSLLEHLYESLLLEVLNLFLVSEEDVLKQMREDLTEVLSIILDSMR